MIIAIPRFDGTLAPCFEAAVHFQISQVEDGEVVGSRIVTSKGLPGIGRVRTLEREGVEILICNGISTFYRDLLEAAGVTVIPNVTLSAERALQTYLQGLLPVQEPASGSAPPLEGVHHQDLVCWARQLFDSHGYQVDAPRDSSPGLLDLVARIRCPACGASVAVAVCCGAHTDQAIRELREFHFRVPDRYDAQVFVHPTSPELQSCCKAFGVELIDPNWDPALFQRSSRKEIPVLQKPIPNHERAAPRSLKQVLPTSAVRTVSGQGRREGDRWR